MTAAVMVTVDAHYADMLQLFLGSLHRHYPNHPDVLVCTTGWNAPLQDRFRRLFPFVTWVDAAYLEWHAGPPMQHQETFDHSIMYARWAALTTRFDRYDQVLYLDADILVLEPLDTLFDADRLVAFEERYPDKATLVFNDRCADGLKALLEADELGDYDWSIAANAGVIVWPRSVRAAGHLAAAERITRHYAPYLMWGDQSLLNVWMARYRLGVTHDCRFNYQLRLVLRDQAQCCPFRDVKILHFNGQRPDRLFLMALSFLVVTSVPGGLRMLPTVLRIAASRLFHWLPGYRIWQALRRKVIERALTGAAS